MAMEIGSSFNMTGQYSGATGTINQRVNVKTETSNAEQTAKNTQAYLNDLRRKYSAINITVVDFKSERQERDYMLGCSGGNNVAISSSIVEKMAQDPETAAKYEKVIEEVPKVFDELKKNIESDPGSKLIASGAMIDKNGKVTYWSVSSKTTVSEGSGTREKMQKLLEEKRLERKKKEKAEEEQREKQKKMEEIMIERDHSATNLIAKLKNDSTNVVYDNKYNSIETGSQFDRTV